MCQISKFYSASLSKKTVTKARLLIYAFYLAVFLFAFQFQSQGHCNENDSKYRQEIENLNRLKDHILYKAEEEGMAAFAKDLHGQGFYYGRYLYDYQSFKRCFFYYTRASEEWFAQAIKYNTGVIQEFRILAQENIANREIQDARFYEDAADNHQKILNKLKKSNPVVQRTLQNGWNTIQQNWLNLLSLSGLPKDPFLGFQKSLLLFDLGESFEALSCIEDLIENDQLDTLLKAEEINRRNFFSNVGQSYSETGQYEKALECLNKVISENPKSKTLYLDRAATYFELGNFDIALNDYLTAEVPFVPYESDIEISSYASGVVKGIVKGTIQAGTEYFPAMLSSLQGIGHGLWSFAQDPVNISSEFVQSLQSCLEFAKTHTSKEIFQEIIPELKDLLENWDQYEKEKKGELAGEIIGKYGVDIFAGAGIAKGVKAYRDLKKANNILTCEAMAISKRNQEIIQLEAYKRSQARKEVFKNGILKIETDKQGKHIIGHRNYNINANKSIFEHANPQLLINKFAGTGVKVGNKLPGTSGYQEIVNFKEFIGFSIDKETGEKISTCWGKIHYAEKGVHIVPTRPRG